MENNFTYLDNDSNNKELWADDVEDDGLVDNNGQVNSIRNAVNDKCLYSIDDIATEADNALSEFGCNAITYRSLHVSSYIGRMKISDSTIYRDVLTNSECTWYDMSRQRIRISNFTDMKPGLSIYENYFSLGDTDSD